MFFFYQIIVSIVILFSPIIILIRIFKKKEHPIRFKEKFCFFSEKRGNGNTLWFHGSSVGEISSVIPLIVKLEKNNSIKKILLTSSTLSSAYIFKKFKLKKTVHQFFPIDSKFLTKKFLDHWKPSIAIFIESEIWPNMFVQIKKKSIPLVLINARVTKKAFSKWNKVEKFSKYIFNKIDIAYPQNLETLKYLKKFQISKIKVIGNLKFSEIKNTKTPSLSKSFIKQINNKKVWCGSSTHADEELICAKTHINLKKKYKNLLTIIIPRHTNRVEEILNKIQDLGLNVILHSSNKKNLNNTDIYIVDTYGDTQKFYKISNPVFLGGSLSHPEIKKGGQNPIEAARLGAKIIHGPNVGNFKEVYQLFQNKKISYKVNSVFQLTKLVDKLIQSSKNKDLKIRNIGDKILSKTSNEIINLLKNEIKKT